jgi:hypothetical protein
MEGRKSELMAHSNETTRLKSLLEESQVRTKTLLDKIKSKVYFRKSSVTLNMLYTQFISKISKRVPWMQQIGQKL